jgi:glycosyltransferase involved in cell wall biosynthesis
MKIIYLHQYFNTPTMSGFSRPYEISKRLVKMGHEVHIVTALREGPKSKCSDWIETEEAGIRVHWCPLPYSNQLAYRARIRAFIKFAVLAGPRMANIRGDIVYASSAPLTIALPAVYASWRHRVPMVFEVRDLWPQLPIAVGALKNPVAIAAARALERFAYRRSRHVVALSPDMKAGVVATGYPAEQVSVIPNSCNFNFFDVDPDSGHQFRERYEWLGDRPLVVYTGTLGIMNGVEYLARLAAAVSKRDADIRFVVAGTGKEEERIRRMAESLNILDKSFFMLGSLPKTEMPSLLSASNLTTSLFIDVKEMWANSANKFFDSLAARRPIAINYGGWQAVMIRESGAGLLLDVHDVEASADQLVARLRDPEWLAAAGSAAHRLGRNRFDLDDLTRQLNDVLIAAAS